MTRLCYEHDVRLVRLEHRWIVITKVQEIGKRRDHSVSWLPGGWIV